ncbi:MAG: DUF58 domain-containing protein [Pseudanabaena frigida]|uniref:DUF58 domain-containing protein n=1 Tax=Pseudanabaena frigida TaxID=945775 RepID=A0A2W4W5C6_9CYAN|nr:MAG: DUF58 domain-containing protein [Pseudanabaena frigida]
MSNSSSDRKQRSSKPKKVSQIKRFFKWLEWRFATPEFIGGMYTALTLFFFMAATNTLSGWLYVISGVSFALLIVGAVMPKRLLAEMVVVRSQIDPVSVGEDIWIDLTIQNKGRTEKRLLEVRDVLPENLSSILQQEVVIELIAPLQEYRWTYEAKTTKRGVFLFRSTEIATSSPLGLFRSRRACPSGQKAIVYPTVLPLDNCPLVDRLGTDTSPRQYSDDHNYSNATEGLTKTLRPYRWGDPTRLIHWRTSAKFGELRVRELEVTIGGQEVAIALDTSIGWQPEAFEEAVVAAASLYFYAQKSKLSVRLWTKETGIIQSDRAVLETLAAANISTSAVTQTEILKELPDLPVVWLSHYNDSIAYLPFGSRWVLWQTPAKVSIPNQRSLGLTIETISYSDDLSYKSLRSQLQQYLTP